ncbi:MAG: aspartate aminotransferase family protein, partial [Conexivisphaera sp.]
ARAVVEELSDIRVGGRRVAVNAVGSMFQVFMREPPVANADDVRGSDGETYSRFHEALTRSGVFSPPSQTESWFASAAHGEEEVALTVEAIRRARPR